MTFAMNRGLDTRVAIPWIAAAALAVLLAITVFAGSEASIVPRSNGGSAGPVEVATNPVPAYIQESIIYGEMAPGSVADSAILPPYVVESAIYRTIDS
jgi:hypothetical protein